MRAFKIVLPVLFVVAGLAAAQPVQALPSGFRESIAVRGLTQPTAMAFAPDGRLFVTEQCGKIRLIKGGVLQTTPFASVRTDCAGERGLIGIALDPNFTRTGFVYIYYTVPSTPRFNRVARLTVGSTNPNVAQRGSFQPIFNLNHLSSATNHNGGGIHFGLDGKLYIGVGDNANSSNAQTLSNKLGKLLRINRDGTIPSDNLFYSRAAGSNRSIWALGLRNPYSFGVDPGTGKILINDVGQDRWEEINRGVRGANYGWPRCEGRCSVAGMTNPIYAYAHSASAAITGGTFNRGRNFPSAYNGDYFFGDYINGFIRRLKPNGIVMSFHTTANSPVDMAFGPNGKLYYLSIYTGRLYRLEYRP